MSRKIFFQTFTLANAHQFIDALQNAYKDVTIARNKYFDTPSLDLLQQGQVLRLCNGTEWCLVTSNKKASRCQNNYTKYEKDLLPEGMQLLDEFGTRHVTIWLTDTVYLQFDFAKKESQYFCLGKICLVVKQEQSNVCASKLFEEQMQRVAFFHTTYGTELLQHVQHIPELLLLKHFAKINNISEVVDCNIIACHSLPQCLQDSEAMAERNINSIDSVQIEGTIQYVTVENVQILGMMYQFNSVMNNPKEHEHDWVTFQPGKHDISAQYHHVQVLYELVLEIPSTAVFLGVHVTGDMYVLCCREGNKSISLTNDGNRILIEHDFEEHSLRMECKAKLIEYVRACAK